MSHFVAIIKFIENELYGDDYSYSEVYGYTVLRVTHKEYQQKPSTN